MERTSRPSPPTSLTSPPLVSGALADAVAARCSGAAPPGWEGRRAGCPAGASGEGRGREEKEGGGGGGGVLRARAARWGGGPSRPSAGEGCRLLPCGRSTSLCFFHTLLFDPLCAAVGRLAWRRAGERSRRGAQHTAGRHARGLRDALVRCAAVGGAGGAGRLFARRRGGGPDRGPNGLSRAQGRSLFFPAGMLRATRPKCFLLSYLKRRHWRRRDGTAG